MYRKKEIGSLHFRFIDELFLIHDFTQIVCPSVRPNCSKSGYNIAGLKCGPAEWITICLVFGYIVNFLKTICNPGLNFNLQVTGEKCTFLHPHCGVKKPLNT